MQFRIDRVPEREKDGALPRKGAFLDAGDEDLMLRVSQGDQQAFRRLAERHAARTIALASRMTGNQTDAEEIVQEAMLRVWVHAPRWRPEAAFRTWLYRVVVNLSLNRRRRKPSLPLDVAEDVPDSAPDSADVLVRQQTDRIVAEAVMELPERQRAAIVLTYYEGLSNEETASALETTVPSVEALLVRARRKLRSLLRDLDEATNGEVRT